MLHVAGAQRGAERWHRPSGPLTRAGQRPWPCVGACVRGALQVFILVGAGVQNSDYIMPDAGDFNTYVTAVQSNILRFGVEVAFLLVLWIGQARGFSFLLRPTHGASLLGWRRVTRCGGCNTGTQVCCGVWRGCGDTTEGP